MWLHTTVLTAFFFLISIGFGLSILALASGALIQKSSVTRLQVITLAFTLGGPGTGIFLQSISLISTNIKITLGILIVVSLFGFLATRTVWLPRREDRNNIAIWIALSIPLALVTWWWSFGAFSHFPFGDLGADVHWMKIAREAADTGEINSYGSQSYTDLRAALAGSLSGTFGLDLLQFNWTYRYCSILYLMLVFYAFADSIFINPSRKWFAFFFAAASNTVGLVTNSSLAVAGALVFMSVLLRIDARAKAQRQFAVSNFLPAAGAFVAILLAFFLDNNALTLASLPIIALVFNGLNRASGAAGNITATTFTCLIWSIALIFDHRGSYLFVPTAIFGWLFYKIVSRILSKTEAPLVKILWAVAVLLPLVCLCILAGISAGRLGYLSSMSTSKLFSYVTVLILGRAIKDGDEITLGAGSDIAAIEIGRAMGPFFAIGIGLIAAWWCNANRPARLKQLVTASDGSESTTRLLWSWIMGCGLCLVTLSGFPFLYRLIFIISGFFTIATTELFFQSFIDPLPDPLKRRRGVAAIAAFIIAVLVAALYAFNWRSDLPYRGYQSILRPFEIAGVALVLLFATLTFTRNRQVQILGLVATIGLGVTVDRSGIATIFRVYSYGRVPDHVVTTSHYNESDLNAARWLHDNMRDAIVVSDPYTLGLFKAIAGVPGLYLFSNLDTVNDATAHQVKNIISAVAEPDTLYSNQALKTCTAISPLLATLNEEALVQMGWSRLLQGIFRHVRANEVKNKIIRQADILDAPLGRWNVVAIVNPRTIQWLHLEKGQRLSYFPVEGTLSPTIVEVLRNGPFRVLFSDDQNAIVLITCI